MLWVGQWWGLVLKSNSKSRASWWRYRQRLKCHPSCGNIILPPSPMPRSTTMQLLSALHAAVCGQWWGLVSVKSNSRTKTFWWRYRLCPKYHVMSFWPLRSLPSSKTRKTATSFFFSALSYTGLLSIFAKLKATGAFGCGEQVAEIWFWPKCGSLLHTDKLHSLTVSTEALLHMYCVH